MKRRRRIINISIALFLLLQLALYIAAYQGKYNPDFALNRDNWSFAHYFSYYLGLNMWLFPAIILLIISIRMKRKLKRRDDESCKLVESIGKLS